MENLFNKIITEKFSNPEEDIDNQVQGAFKTLSRHDQKRTSPCHIIVKMLRVKNKERILKTAREKHQVNYKCKTITITLKDKGAQCVSNSKSK
jgi:hypothetical protein